MPEFRSGEIEEHFGAEEVHLVAAMTEDPGIADLAARRAALRRQIGEAGPDATAVYAADKATKVRELGSRLIAGPGRLESRPRERERLEHYRESLRMLEEVTPDHPLVCRLRFELEALDALPPRIESGAPARE
jgi:hypothetical protein